MNIITEIKHVIYRENLITMTINIDETEKEFIVDTGPPVTKIPPDKEIKRQKDITNNTKISGRQQK